jgi:hypothetical protein
MTSEVAMQRLNIIPVALVAALGLLGACAVPVSERSATAFENARLIVGDGSVIENGTLVVEGERIAQAGRRGDVRVPAGARRVDLAGKTIMPTIIDTHVGPAKGDRDFAPRTFGAQLSREPR